MVAWSSRSKMREDEEEVVEPSAEALAALASLMPAMDVATVQEDDKGRDDASMQEEGTEEDEFEYKLFSSTKPVKINIAEPAAVEYATPVRPMSYYRHTPIDQSILQCVVVTGEDVIAASRDQWATTGRVIVIKEGEETKKKRWRPSMARRKKFQALKAAEAERERKRLELRAIGRNRGRGRGRGQARGGGNMTREGHKAVKEQRKLGGYPRKGAPAV